MNRARRKFLSLAMGAMTAPMVSRFAQAQSRPLAERLPPCRGLRYVDLDDATIERVRMHVIDALGCGIAAFDESPVRICRKVALASTSGASSVIGTNRRTTPDLAAFANGAAFRYYDLNDVYVGPFSGHPSDNIAPLLAIAEAERAGAKELITAIVLAYEVNCRLCDAFDLSARGWDPPIFSLPAVALAVGKLMKLPPDKLTHAVNLAINDHIPMGQTRSGELSDWKGIADAEAGRNALFAAMLARGGLTGPAPIFEASEGVLPTHIRGQAKSISMHSVGAAYLSAIHQCSVKAYPVVVYGQTAVVAGATPRRRPRSNRIDRDRNHPPRLRQTGSDPEKWAPETRETADHSLPYIAARAMFDGDVSNDSYAPAKLRDPRILAFMRKITVKEDPAFITSQGTAPAVRIPALLRRTARMTRQVDSMPGFPGQPLSRADVERKFRSNIGKRWPQERTDTILQALWALDRTNDPPALLGGLSRCRHSRYFSPPISHTSFHSLAVTGCTDKRPYFTSAISCNRGSALTAASVTGFGTGSRAITSTTTQGVPGSAVGS